jgi:UDP-N-acetylmuramoyl-L-alanyl-D-glutamate--2,6-diaminopimelate ligase
MDRKRSGLFIEIDRREAIRAAVRAARVGDIVAVCGKGHEDYQIVGTTRYHFDDREEAQKALVEWRAS